MNAEHKQFNWGRKKPEIQTPKSGVEARFYRRYLPHFDAGGILQMITYHLADSLPASVIRQLEIEMRALPAPQRESFRRDRIEYWIDAGLGSCILKEPEIARLIIDNWKFYEGNRYDIVAFVVMPNHIHILICVYGCVPLFRIVQSWKGYSGKKIQERFNSKGIPDYTTAAGNQVWHREYWDRVIRNHRHLCNAVRYIYENPVRAKLVATPDEWPWSWVSTLPLSTVIEECMKRRADQT